MKSNPLQTVGLFAAGIGGACLSIAASLIASGPAEAGPRCGQYETKQERQICRGLRDGIRREIREGDHTFTRYDRWHPSVHRPFYWDNRTQDERAADGIHEGLCREGLISGKDCRKFR